MTRSRVFWIVLLSLSVHSAFCRADLMETTFEGRLSFVSVQADLAGRFALGDLMRVTITYDWPGVDSRPADPYSGLYDSIRSFSLTVDSTVPYSASATTGTWSVQNGESGSMSTADQVFAHTYSDLFGGSGDLTGPDIGGLPLNYFLLQLHDNSGTALSSDALPMTFTPTDFNNNQLTLYWRDGGVNRPITVTEFTSSTRLVPLPGAALLAALGLSVAGRRIRRQRS